MTQRIANVEKSPRKIYKSYSSYIIESNNKVNLSSLSSSEELESSSKLGEYMKNEEKIQLRHVLINHSTFNLANAIVKNLTINSKSIEKSNFRHIQTKSDNSFYSSSIILNFSNSTDIAEFLNTDHIANAITKNTKISTTNNLRDNLEENRIYKDSKNHNINNPTNLNHKINNSVTTLNQIIITKGNSIETEIKDCEINTSCKNEIYNLHNANTHQIDKKNKNFFTLQSERLPQMTEDVINEKIKISDFLEIKKTLNNILINKYVNIKMNDCLSNSCRNSLNIHSLTEENDNKEQINNNNNIIINNKKINIKSVNSLINHTNKQVSKSALFTLEGAFTNKLKSSFLTFESREYYKTYRALLDDFIISNKKEFALLLLIKDEYNKSNIADMLKTSRSPNNNYEILNDMLGIINFEDQTLIDSLRFILGKIDISNLQKNDINIIIEHFAKIYYSENLNKYQDEEYVVSLCNLYLDINECLYREEHGGTNYITTLEIKNNLYEKYDNMPKNIIDNLYDEIKDNLLLPISYTIEEIKIINKNQVANVSQNASPYSPNIKKESSKSFSFKLLNSNSNNINQNYKYANNEDLNLNCNSPKNISTCKINLNKNGLLINNITNNSNNNDNFYNEKKKKDIKNIKNPCCFYVNIIKNNENNNQTTKKLVYLDKIETNLVIEDISKKCLCCKNQKKIRIEEIIDIYRGGSTNLDNKKIENLETMFTLITNKYKIEFKNDDKEKIKLFSSVLSQMVKINFSIMNNISFKNDTYLKNNNINNNNNNNTNNNTNIINNVSANINTINNNNNNTNIISNVSGNINMINNNSILFFKNGFSNNPQSNLNNVSYNANNNKLIKQKEKIWEIILNNWDKYREILKIDQESINSILSNIGLKALFNKSLISNTLNKTIEVNKNYIIYLWSLGLPKKLRKGLWLVFISNKFEICENLFFTIQNYDSNLINRNSLNTFKENNSFIKGESNNNLVTNSLMYNSEISPIRKIDKSNIKKIKKNIENIYNDFKKTIKKEKDIFTNEMLNIIKSFCIFRVDVIYCKPISYICSIFYFNSFSSYDCFVLSSNFIIQNYLFKIFIDEKVYIEQFNNFFIFLLQKYLNDLYAHFIDIKFDIIKIFAKWYKNIFIRCFPYDIILRIFDNFILKKEIFIFQFSLAILYSLQDILNNCYDYKEINYYLLHYPSESFNIDELFNLADKFNIYDIYIDEFDNFEVGKEKIELLKDL